MAGKIKVLQINYDSSEYSGVAVFLLNIYRHLDHNKIQVDFLTPNTTSYNSWREEIEHTGGHIFEFHINICTREGRRMFGKRLRFFLEENSYDIVHINSGRVSFNCISAVAAKSKGVKVVVHSHNAGKRSWWKQLPVFFIKLRMQKNADVLCACSTEAAQTVFTLLKVNSGNVIIVNNGIDLHKFCYDEKRRNIIRREFNLENNFVVGHIGRFAEQKNHEFLIDIFSEIISKNPTAYLLLIGEGKLEPIIREKVHKLDLEDQVIFLGKRNDVENLYQAMDVFVFPSLYEGLPITLVEAQASGLPCCISDVISLEVDMTPLIHRMSLNEPAIKWAQTAITCVVDDDSRQSYAQDLEESGFGIKASATQIEQIYKSLV